MSARPAVTAAPPVTAVPHGRTLLSVAETAARFARSSEWFRRHRRRLERDTGFPPPVLPGLWDPVAIDRWLDSRMPAHLHPAHPPEAETPEAAPDAAARRARLAARADAIAGE